MGLTAPNHTQYPNEIIDKYLPVMGDAELRVVTVVVRKTKGYHKRMDYISTSQLMEMTGLSKNGVKQGIKDAIARGIIKRADGAGFRGIVGYELNYDDDSTGSASDPLQGQPVTPSQSSKGSASDPTKERDSKKKDKRKKIDAPASSASNSWYPLASALAIEMGCALEDLPKSEHGKYFKVAKDLGSMSNPITPHKAKSLIAYARQHPRGRMLTITSLPSFVGEWRNAPAGEYDTPDPDAPRHWSLRPAPDRNAPIAPQPDDLDDFLLHIFEVIDRD